MLRRGCATAASELQRGRSPLGAYSAACTELTTAAREISSDDWDKLTRAFAVAAGLRPVRQERDPPELRRARLPTV